MPSPCSLATVPPNRLTAAFISSIAGAISAKASSGSRPSTIVVDPTMSANKIETSLRSALSEWEEKSDDVALRARRTPQRLQKLLSAALDCPHWPHTLNAIIAQDRY